MVRGISCVGVSRDGREVSVRKPEGFQEEIRDGLIERERGRRGEKSGQAEKSKARDGGRCSCVDMEAKSAICLVVLRWRTKDALYCQSLVKV